MQFLQKLLKFILWVVGIFAVLFVIGRLTIFETWTIPDNPVNSASIAPTLRPGDTVLVLTSGESSFGDLVRCPDPETPSNYVIGRVYGLGGDSVEVTGQSVRVNGSRYDSTDACTEPLVQVPHPDTKNPVELQCARVNWGGGWHYRATATKYKKANDHKKDVETNRVYLLSDNRDMHDDSRDFGTLDKETCNQRIIFLLWGAGGWTDSDRRLEVVR